LVEKLAKARFLGWVYNGLAKIFWMTAKHESGVSQPADASGMSNRRLSFQARFYLSILFVLNFWIALEGAWFSVVEDVVFRNIFEKLAQKPPALNRTTFK
jgi:hypothetical protein